MDLGVEEYLLSDVLRGVAAQRLVRSLCPICSMPAGAERMRLYEHSCSQVVVGLSGAEPANWREPVGCSACGETGFRGRLGLYEIAPVTPSLAQAVRRRASGSELFATARQDGFVNLFEDALLKARKGLTAMSEVYRVIGPNAPDLVAELRREAISV